MKVSKTEIVRTIRDLMVDQDHECYDEFWMRAETLCSKLDKQHTIWQRIKRFIQY